ncbi:hypothetical protein BGX28_003684 [Mortierella sp. GBA30]|nr:hypothetical protein BGX28_003684 [Mortierella sp. GBA30]
MIHAYLFVTKAIQDHDGHGPDFQYHMNRINAEAQTTITVYHTFHDEVAHYQTHIWKCNGPCQYRPPYYGIVKRSMNRPPQPADRWYAEHQSTCGGTYTKISEPEPSKKKSSKSAKNAKQDTAIPRARTLLDDFLSGSKPIAKPSTLSSTTETGAVANKLLRSKLPSLNSTIDEKSNGIKIESNGTITTIEDAKFPASTTSGNIPDSQDTTQDGKNSAEQQRPSAREAAAAAAMARFEQHLKLQGHDASLAKDIVVPVTKRRDPGLASVSEVDSAQNWNKKIKTEHTRRGDSDTSPPGVKREIEKEQEEEEYNTVESDLATMTLVQCPVCSNHVEEATINDHVDLCIWRTSGGAD